MTNSPLSHEATSAAPQQPRTATLGAATDDGRIGTPAQAILLLLISCLPVLGAVLLSPVLPVMSAEFATTPGVETLVPMVLTAPALLIAVLSPIAGRITDRVGRKRVLLVAMVAYAIIGVAPMFLGSLVAIVVARALLGVCEAFIMTAATTLIADYFAGSARARYLSLQTVVTTLSATAFLAIGGALGAHGWRTTFWMYAISLLLFIPALLMLWEPKRQARGGAVSMAKFPWRTVALPLAMTLVAGMFFYTLIVHLPYILTVNGFAETSAIGMAMAGMSLATAVGAFSFNLLHRFGPKVALTIALALTAIGFILVWQGAGQVPLIITGAVIAGAGTGLLLPTLLTWTIAPLAAELRGAGTGTWTGLQWIGQFVCPIIVLAIAGSIPNLGFAVGVFGIAAIVITIVALVITPRRLPELS